MSIEATISAVIYGPAGVGKSTIISSAPGPRLIIEAEGGSRYQRVPKIVWDPKTQPPPTAEDLTENTSVLVNVTSWEEAEAIHKYLLTNNHPYRTVAVDTLTELQSRLVDRTGGTDQLQQNQWGTVKRVLEDYLRKLRDLTLRADNNVQVVLFIAQEDTRGKQVKPAIQGSAANSIPTFVDLVGYMHVMEGSGSPRGLLVTPVPSHVAKDRVGTFREKFGDENGIAVIGNPNIRAMLEDIANDPSLLL